jgi:Pyridine nucleotide-disulphide oxidoreductase
MPTCYSSWAWLWVPSALALGPSTTGTVPWLIVGGGIHGVHIATRLLGQGVTKDLCIVDDGDCLLQKWKIRTASTGMEYLRSSAGHHLDLAKDSLRKFGKQQPAPSSTELFAKDYERPQLEFFNQHCDAIISGYELDQKHIQGLVTNLEPEENFVRVVVSQPKTGPVRYTAEHVVLALGNDHPCYPEWVQEDMIHSGLVTHLLDTNKRPASDHGSEVAIVGGGITAAHKAIQLAQHHPDKTKIHLISRHSLAEQQFDTHQDWMMDQAAAERSRAAGGSGLPQRQLEFQETTCLQKRRQIIQRERIPGTVTAAVNRGRQGLQYLIQENRVQFHEAEVTSVSISQPQTNACQCELHLSSGNTIAVDSILLATGFGKQPPFFVDRSDEFPTSDFCGYPIVNSSLQWGHPRIFVTGALAELELGPSARNIAGARLAAERILQAASKSQ